MDDTPQLAKLTRPRLKGAVARERLFEFMDEACDQPVAWVCAPPGAGKTTLVGSYLEARALPYLWYQLDAGDGDVATYFHYLEIAAQTLALRHNIQPPLHHHTPLPHFTPDHLPSLSLFTQRFFEALFTCFTSPAAQGRASAVGAGCAGTAAVLVLDNYQDVPPDSPLHALLAEAFTQVPHGVNVVVLSRAEPPTAYARLRANGAVAWLGYEQLKLTHAEASTIAKGRASKPAGDDITPAIIEKLCAITHGWAAGLTLLLEHRRATGANPPPSLLTGTATPQVVFDYFAREVFQRFDTVQRNIIVQAALLPDMDAGAVRDLTGDARAPEVLAHLARRNYFTQVLVHRDKQALAVASDILTLAHPCAAHREEPTYRFHPLFRAFLLNQAQHAFAPEHLTELQRHAARVLEDRGNTEDAIDLLHQVGDWDNAARLIVTHAPKLAMNGRLQTLDTWIHRLPGPFVDRSPWLLYWLSQCRLGFDPATARAGAERAYALFDVVDDAAGLYLTWATVTNSYIMECMNFKPLDNWFVVLNALQRRHPIMPSVEIEANVTCAVLGAMVWRAEHIDLDYWRDRAAVIIYGCDSDQPLSQRILLSAYLHVDATLSGRIGQIETLTAILRPLVESASAAPLQRILGYTALNVGAYLCGARAEWMAGVTAVRALASESGIHHVDHLVLHGAVYGALMANDLPTAEEFLREMACAIRDGRMTDDIAAYHNCAAMVALHQGALGAAQEHCLRGLEAVVSKGAVLPQILGHICMAQILFALGNTVVALEHLRQAHGIATRMSFNMLVFACVLSEAQFALEFGQATEGLEHLRQALAMSRHIDGQFSPFWTHATLVKLFSTALQHGIEVDHVQCMIRRLNIIPDVPPVEVEHWPWAVKIYTLDRFTVLLHDGQPLSFTGKAQKRPLELLKALIALGGREVGVQTLIDTLWGDADGDAGQGSFNSALHRLRKLLGEERTLVVQDGRLTLSAHYVWVDAWAFSRMLGHSDAAIQIGESARLEELTTRIFALYRTPFLADIAAPWAVPMRERLQARFLQYVLHIGDHYGNVQQWHDAARLYERALEINPLAEDFYRRLMTAYLHLDRRADALRVDQRCGRVLGASFGVPPSHEIRSLRDDLYSSKADSDSQGHLRVVSLKSADKKYKRS